MSTSRLPCVLSRRDWLAALSTTFATFAIYDEALAASGDWVAVGGLNIVKTIDPKGRHVTFSTRDAVNAVTNQRGFIFSVCRGNNPPNRAIFANSTNTRSIFGDFIDGFGDFLSRVKNAAKAVKEAFKKLRQDIRQALESFIDSVQNGLLLLFMSEVQEQNGDDAVINVANTLRTMVVPNGNSPAIAQINMYANLLKVRTNIIPLAQVICDNQLKVTTIRNVLPQED